MQSHPLSNFEIQNYYQNESKFICVYSRTNLPKIKDGAYVINLAEFKSTGNYCISLYLNDDIMIYFHSFGVEHISEEIKKVVGNKNILTNVDRRHA